jgi:hypothetical protein
MSQIPISVYPDIGPNIGTFFYGTRHRVPPDIGYFPISGHTRYREIPNIGYDPISGNTRYRVLKIRLDIGSDIQIYGYCAMYIPISGHPIMISRHILSDILPDIMTFLLPVLLFPAAAADAAAAATYSMLRNPSY